MVRVRRAHCPQNGHDDSHSITQPRFAADRKPGTSDSRRTAPRRVGQRYTASDQIVPPSLGPSCPRPPQSLTLPAPCPLVSSSPGSSGTTSASPPCPSAWRRAPKKNTHRRHTLPRSLVGLLARRGWVLRRMDGDTSGSASSSRRSSQRSYRTSRSLGGPDHRRLGGIPRQMICPA